MAHHLSVHGLDCSAHTSSRPIVYGPLLLLALVVGGSVQTSR